MNKTKLKAIAAKVIKNHILTGGECFSEMTLHEEGVTDWWPTEKEEAVIDQYCQDILKPFLQRLQVLHYQQDKELNELLLLDDDD